MKLLIGMLVVLPALALAAPAVMVKGLFQDSAVLQIDGRQRLLKVGARSPEGVRLLAADSRRATLDVAGKVVVLGLNRSIGTRFEKARVQQVRLARGRGGHYMSPGRINGLPVEFLVDTGATYVSMGLNTAKRLGIPYWRGRKTLSQTANGVIESFVLPLDKVSVGAITLHNVQGSVSMVPQDHAILLGNSFISKLNWREEQGVLVLEQRFQ